MSTAAFIEASPILPGASEPPTPRGESRVLDGELLARGVPIGELIDRASFLDSIFFQVLARYPTGSERAMIDAYLVSLCEHGVTSPSTHGARVAASVRAPFAACAISFIAGAMGPYHFGALENAMHELRLLAASGEEPEAFVARRLATAERIWGFGHRFHKSAPDSANPDRLDRLQEHADPRVRALTRLADRLQWDGPHLALARAVGRRLYERKRIPINIDGLGAGLLLDMGFPPQAAMLFVILGRLPNIARLCMEEHEQTPNRFVALATTADPGFARTTVRDLPAAV